MLLNILLGFIIPWIFGIILYLKDKRTLLLIAPLSSAISYLINEFGYHLDFWRLVPVKIEDCYTSISVNMGLYPVLASYLIHYVAVKRKKPLNTVLTFCLITAGLEYIGIKKNLIAYHNGWNIWWTFVIYIVSYSTVYLYYLKLRKIGVLR